MVTHAMASEPSPRHVPPERHPGRRGQGRGAGVDPRHLAYGGQLDRRRRAPRGRGDRLGRGGRGEEGGTRPKVVSHSMEDLKSVTKALKVAPQGRGHRLAMDYVHNEVVVQADRTVSASDWSRMKKLAASMGSSVRMERTRARSPHGSTPPCRCCSTGGRAVRRATT